MEDSRILITRRSKEPTLLNACRQVRCEARPLWYFLNRFDVKVIACDFKRALAFQRSTLQTARLCNHGQGNWKAEITLDFTLTGVKRWDRLVEWCRELHGDGELLPVAQCYGKSRIHRFVAAAHAIAVASRGNSWEGCLEALNALRPVLWNKPCCSNSALFWSGE